MKDQSKTKQVLIQELVSLRRRVAKLEQSESERKRVDDALRLDSEILANMREGVQLTRIDDGVIVYTNRSFEVLFGYDPGELVGNHVSILNAPGAKSPEDVANDIIKSLSQKGVWNGEIHNLKKDGTSFWCYVNISEFKYQQYGKVWISVHQDITDRKRSEEALRESEERFTKAFRTVPDALIISRLEDGEIVEVNDNWNKVFGYSREEVIGKRSLDLNLFADSADRQRAVALLREQGSVRDFEVQIRQKSGALRTATLSIELLEVRDEQYLLTVVQDITDRRLMEKTIRDSRDLLQSIVDNTPALVYVFNREERLSLVNKALRELVGLPPSEIVGKRRNEFLPQEIVERDEENDRLVIEAGAPLQFEEAGTFNGKTITFLTTKFPLRDERGEIWGIGGISTDISARKKVEEALRDSHWRLESIVEGTNVGTWEWNVQTGETVFNETWAQIVGYTLKELSPISIKTWETLAHPDDLKQSAELLERHFVGELPHYDYECRMKHKDGHWVWVHDRGRIITRTADGKPLMMFGTHTDITERKQAEEELKQSYQRLRALAERLQQVREESRIRIARELHDELGGGLTGLKMDLSLLSQKIEGEKEGKDYDFLMKRIHSSNQLIDRLIRNVRLIGTKLRPSVLDDLGLIAALEWESDEFANRTGIPCEFVPDFEHLSLQEATATAVFRIFQEALTNVARHSGADKVTVLFREDDGYLYLEVMDNGRGITEGEILNMKSLGILGMRERALVFGGELSVSGEPGRGTTVVLKIPGGREKSS